MVSNHDLTTSWFPCTKTSLVSHCHDVILRFSPIELSPKTSSGVEGRKYGSRAMRFELDILSWVDT